ncbi:hypothetical protein RclHR1_01130007 [Rhizophagus clarus]|uniref:Uncharacterized protein n=1 Tax=Rhizophagus clarus TaxID=94130 RepID=A0A2Z6Q8E9_9GLOM|nr:hypothetical protein RclHR1_01130007 [Rhizophagus clarus]
MKLFIALLVGMLFFSIIMRKTNATCDDCFTIAKHVLDCNRANIISCAPKQFDDPTKGYPVPFQDCCENENVALCTEGCHDQSVTDMFQSFCPYIPPHC